MDNLFDYKKFAILYVDDEEKSLKAFERAFGDDFRVLTAPNALEGFRFGVEAAAIAERHALIGQIAKALLADHGLDLVIDMLARSIDLGLLGRGRIGQSRSDALRETTTWRRALPWR